MPSEDSHLWRNREAISVEYNESDVISAPQHDGSVIRLRKTHSGVGMLEKINNSLR